MRTIGSTRPARLLGAAALGLALTLTAAACGNDRAADDTDISTELSATEHNEVDVAFATDMMQHHAQALVMVDMTLGRPLDPEVERLVEDIRTAQTREIETFTNWLTDWGEEIPETVRDHANAGHDMGDMGESMDGMDQGDMPGMMSADDMQALADAGDGEFQQMWLEMMIEHHQGAIEMAETEQEEGRYEPAVDLAGTIIETQTAEIETMRSILD